MKNRILAALLFVAMLMTLLPTAALADDADVQPEALAADDTAVLSDDVTIVKSGSCGDNVTYTLDSNGLLTISGTGDMADYSKTNRAPWYLKNYDDPKVYSLIIDYGVTGIGTYAFDDCDIRTGVTIPESVTSIGNYAFNGCDYMKSLSIPGSVKSIGKCAFFCCYDVETLTIGNGVESIGNSAFANLIFLTGVTIPGSVKTIGDSAFSGCSRLQSVTMENGVESIGSSAFYNCTNLPGITIPESVESIGISVFSACTRLASVSLPESITSISDFTFQGCTSLTEFDIPANVTEIGYGAFNKCTGLTEMTIPGNVKTLGDTVFADCTGLIGVTIENGVETIGDSAFRGDTGLTTITIPNSVTSLGYMAFWNCTGLTSAAIGNGVTSLSGTFEGCTALSDVILGNGLITIESGAFSGCTSLTDVTLPDSVEMIGSSAFSGCTGLTSVNIPENVTTIGDMAFSNCSSLTEMTLPDSVSEIGSSAFRGCSSITSVSIGSGVTSIESGAFSGCTSLTDVYISDLTAWCGITYDMYTGNPFCCASNLYLNGKLVTELVVPDGVSKINDFAFYQCECLTSVTIPDGVAVGMQAFSGCTGLTSLTTGSGTLGDRAFESCTALNEIKFTGEAPDARVTGSYHYDVDVDTIDWSTVTQEWLAEHRTFEAENGPFKGVTATAYYPSGDDTWTSEAMAKIGTLANLTWIPYETHRWDDGRITTQPTCTEAGEMLYTCTDCGAAKTAVIPALGHDYSYADNGDGTHTATCSRCGNVVTEEHNYVNLVCACGAVDTSAHIVTQPNGGEATFGQTVTISVKAVNAKAYQWYYSKDGGENWTKLYWTGAKTDTLEVEYKASRAAFQYKCRVKGNDGTILYTEPTSITQGTAPDGEITKQPGTVYGNVGENVSLKIAAKNAITYQWYYSNDDGTHWNKLYWDGAKTATLTFEVKKSRYNYIFYCKITDGNGKAYYSSRGYLRQHLSITKQPKNVTAAYGETASLSVSAVGVQSYRWYLSTDGGTSWTPSPFTGAKSDTVTFDFSEMRVNYLYRCVLTGYDGTTVTTNTVKVIAAG